MNVGLAVLGVIVLTRNVAIHVLGADFAWFEL